MSEGSDHHAPRAPIAGPIAAPARRLWNRWWWLVSGVLIVGLMLVGGFYALLVTRQTPPASFDDALRRQAASPPGSSPRDSVVGPERPPPGVYTASGSGTETLGINPAPQPEGPTLPVEVSVDQKGCTVVRVDFNANHWQTWDYCWQPDSTMVDTGGQAFQRFDLVVTQPENVTTFVCDPPSPILVPEAPPGRQFDQRCTGTSTATPGTVTSAGPATFVGVENLTIGPTDVAARHIRQERTLSGSQSGTEVADTWFTDSGLPLRMERRTHVSSPSPIGDITYDEQGWWQLDSLTPRTG